jgi:uncharacterized membrane protein YbaN (DUF454 family)
MEEHPADRRAPVWVRPVYLLIGFLSLGLGVAGSFVPLLPTVPFLLLAAWCFARSSRQLHGWLVTHRRLGPMIAPFQAGGFMPRRAKLTVLLLMVATFTATFIWLIDGLVPYLMLGAGAVISFAAVLRIPTRPRAGNGADTSDP